MQACKWAIRMHIHREERTAGSGEKEKEWRCNGCRENDVVGRRRQWFAFSLTASHFVECPDDDARLVRPDCLSLARSASGAAALTAAPTGHNTEAEVAKVAKQRAVYQYIDYMLPMGCAIVDRLGSFSLPAFMSIVVLVLSLVYAAFISEKKTRKWMLRQITRAVST